MKKIFTLISMAFLAMSANAQDVYNAIVDGYMAPEFSSVVVCTISLELFP